VEEIEIITTAEKIPGSLTENLERPFNVNVATVSTEDATGSLYYEENFDSANLSVQIDVLIKQNETKK
jgi:hypothetical protein